MPAVTQPGAAGEKTIVTHMRLLPRHPGPGFNPAHGITSLREKGAPGTVAKVDLNRQRAFAESRVTGAGPLKLTAGRTTIAD